jgi:hypothetical protein
MNEREKTGRKISYIKEGARFSRQAEFGIIIVDDKNAHVRTRFFSTTCGVYRVSQIAT